MSGTSQTWNVPVRLVAALAVLGGVAALPLRGALDPTDPWTALALAVVTAASKLATGWYGAGRLGVGRRGRVRAGTALVARGEFSIVTAALGVGLADGGELGALAAAYVLITAIGGPLLTRYADDLVPARLLRVR